MDSDEVNSITDTVEAQQVVQVIKTVYDDLISRANLPINKTLFNLDASGDSTKPILMTKPLSIDYIDWVKYNKITNTGTTPIWAEICFMPLDEFMMMTQGLTVTDSNVGSMTHTANGFTFTFYYRTDIGPSWYTSFNDTTVIFDSYDSAVENTLQTSKTLCFGGLTNTFVESDVWVPNLQPQQFALLLNEAKSLAWVELKQQGHSKAEMTAHKNWVHLQTSKRNTPTYPDHSGPNYGRHNTGSSIPSNLRNST